MSRKINNIREELKKADLSAAALALYLDVNESTVSKWNINVEEPGLKSLDQIGEVLEVDNSKLFHANHRVNTGLAAALQQRYKKLLKEKLPRKIEGKDSNGKKIRINNPEFVSALQDFVKDYRSKNG